MRSGDSSILPKVVAAALLALAVAATFAPGAGLVATLDLTGQAVAPAMS